MQPIHETNIVIKRSMLNIVKVDYRGTMGDNADGVTSALSCRMGVLKPTCGSLYQKLELTDI